MKQVTCLATLLSLSIYFAGCSEPNGPKDNRCIIPDTTTHSFTWQVDTIGDYGSSLRDVAIISDDEVWATGFILVNGKAKNLAVWNDSSWTFSLVPIFSFGDTSRAPINCMYRISDTGEIWIATANNEYGYWNGQNWEGGWVAQFSGEMNSIWASSSSNVYFVGTNGAISHYDGAHWKSFSGITNRDLNDVKGIVDSKTGKTRIWVGGKTTMLYSPDGENWEVIWDLDNPLLDENFINVNALYIPDKCNLIASVWNGVKGRLYKFDQANMNNNEILIEHEAYAHDMDGQSINDIFIAGSFNILEHYNGSSIHNYNQFIGDGWNRGVSYSNNTIFVAGRSYDTFQGIVIRGRRN